MVLDVRSTGQRRCQDGFEVNGEVYLDSKVRRRRRWRNPVGFGVVEFSSDSSAETDVVSADRDRLRDAGSSDCRSLYEYLHRATSRAAEVSGSIDESARMQSASSRHFHFPSTAAFRRNIWCEGRTARKRFCAVGWSVLGIARPRPHHDAGVVTPAAAAAPLMYEAFPC